MIVVLNFKHLFFNQRHVLTKIKKNLFNTIYLFLFNSSILIISWILIFYLDLVQRNVELDEVILFLVIFVQFDLTCHISKFLTIPNNVSIIFETDVFENEFDFFMSPKIVHIFTHFITNYSPIFAFLPYRNFVFNHKIFILENKVFWNCNWTSPIISLLYLHFTSIQVNSNANS